MTDHKSIRRALISSVLAIFLCCAMLVGTTFAWFTDMVTTGRNIIKSGNLDIELEYDLWDAAANNGAGAWADNWQPVDESTVVFDNELWEPGVTEVVRFKVTNAGSLALKYEMGIQVYEETGSVNVYGDEFKLSDYIWVGAAEGSAIATRAEAAAFADTNIWESANLLAEFGQQNMVAGAADEIWTMAIHMPTEVGNEANHLTGEDAPYIGFGVVLMATQLNSEADSYGPDYDENATYPVSVMNAAELNAALAAGKNAVLNANVVLGDVLTVAGGTDVEIEGNGYTLTVPAGGTRIMNADGQTDVNVKLNNVKLDADNAERAISFYNCKNVNLTMSACEAAATHYAINVAKNNENVNLVVENCDITGFAAFQTWSAGTKATFRNCTLTGVNQWNAASGAFATIVIYEGADNCELNFENCTVVATELKDAPQYHVMDKSANSKVNFTDCTFIYNGNTVTAPIYNP